jgi:hypothetical protein
MFADMQNGTWRATTRYVENIQANPATSIVNFTMNEAVVPRSVVLEAATVLAELANDPTGRRVFEGPYCSTGQRAACVPEKGSLDDAELGQMCWLVEGVVEKADPTDPRSADKPAQVPAACEKNR